MFLLRSSPRLNPFLCCVHPRSSARLWSEVGWGWGLRCCGCRNWSDCTATRDLGCLCGSVLTGPVWPRSTAKLWCGVSGARARARVLSLGDERLCTPEHADDNCYRPPGPHPRPSGCVSLKACLPELQCLVTGHFCGTAYVHTDNGLHGSTRSYPSLPSLSLHS